MVADLQHGMDPASVAEGAIALLVSSMHAVGGVIVLGRDGAPQAAFNTAAMPWALAH
jgi:hypothetical protein